jgi:hypothetical protein
MNNSNLQTSEQENSMSTIQKLFQEYLESGGQPKLTSFRFHIEKLMKTDIKPLCGRSGKSSSGNDWRKDLMNRFKGRGSKWVFVSLEEIKDTLDRFDQEGIDTEDYRSWTEKKQKAWIRFYGPRLDNGIKVAAFTVHTLDSTIYQPHTLHYIPIDRLDETITPLNGTPFSLKLEVDDVQQENDTESNEEIIEYISKFDEDLLQGLEDLQNDDL